MIDRNLARALFFMAVAAAFGLGALRYKVGQFSQAGPGLFPLMVSGLLFVIGLIGLVQARFARREPLTFKFKNIALVLLSLCGFAVLSQTLNVVAGVVFLVVCSSFAATSRSWARSLKVSGGLVVIALVMHKLLGLSLPF